MHIKKKCLKIFLICTVIDIKEKTKYNMKARMNILVFCYRENMKLIYDKSQVTKLKVSFTLDNNA